MKFIKSLLISIILLILSPTLTLAQEDFETTLENGVVKEVLEEVKDEEPASSDASSSQSQVYQKLEVELRIENEELRIEVEIGGEQQSNTIEYEEGDKVVVSVTKGPDDQDYYYVTGYQRTGSIIFLTVTFLFVVILVSGLDGFRSIGGLLLSLVVVFVFIIPSILNGSNPIWISVIASLVLVPVTFYLSHGLKKDTTIAVVSTLVSVLITGLLASYFMNATHITGTGIEDAFFLQTTSDLPINLPNLLIAGIIISSLGILDDVTIAQVSLVDKLYEKNSKQDFIELYKESMSLGRHHISSMVNTLVLTYTGSSISLLLLFSVTGTAMHNLLNLEVVALEIVRTLVSSIALMLAIPLTTVVASYSKVNEI